MNNSPEDILTVSRRLASSDAIKLILSEVLGERYVNVSNAKVARALEKLLSMLAEQDKANNYKDE